MSRSLKTFTCSDANCTNTFSGRRRKGLCEPCYNTQYRKICTICKDSYFLDRYKYDLRKDLGMYGQSVITRQHTVCNTIGRTRRIGGRFVRGPVYRRTHVSREKTISLGEKSIKCYGCVKYGGSIGKCDICKKSIMRYVGCPKISHCEKCKLYYTKADHLIDYRKYVINNSRVHKKEIFKVTYEIARSNDIIDKTNTTGKKTETIYLPIPKIKYSKVKLGQTYELGQDYISNFPNAAKSLRNINSITATVIARPKK